MARRPIIVAYVPKFELFLDPLPRTGHFEGIEYLLFTMIMKAARVRYYNLTAIDDFQKKLNNSSWHMLALLWAGYADIGVSSQVVDFWSADWADYTVPYFYSDVNFATNLPQMQSRMYAYLYPFDGTTWAMIAGIASAIPVAFAVLFRVGDFSKNWLHMIGNLVGKSSAIHRIRGPSQVVFVTAWWFGTTILFLSYSSMIFSCLTVPIMEVPPKNFKQLAEAVQKGRYEVRCNYMSTNNILYNAMSSAPIPEVKYVHEAMVKNGWYYEGGSAYREVFKPKTAYIDSSFHLKVHFGKSPFATKLQSEEGISSFYFGMYVNKHRKKLKKRLDVSILRVLQAGLVDKAIEDHFFRMWLKSSMHDQTEDSNKPLSLHEVVGAFYVLIIGLCISTVVFIIECINFKLKKKETKRKLIDFQNDLFGSFPQKQLSTSEN